MLTGWSGVLLSLAAVDVFGCVGFVKNYLNLRLILNLNLAHNLRLNVQNHLPGPSLHVTPRVTPVSLNLVVITPKKRNAIGPLAVAQAVDCSKSVTVPLAA